MAGKTASDLGRACVGDVEELPPAVLGAIFHLLRMWVVTSHCPCPACSVVLPRTRFPQLPTLSLAWWLFLLILG